MEDVPRSDGGLLHIYVSWISRYLSVIQSYHDLSTTLYSSTILYIIAEILNSRDVQAATVVKFARILVTKLFLMLDENE